MSGKKHSQLGASIAKRWLNCPGSVRLTKDLPNVETEYSREGTEAHALLENVLTNWLIAKNHTPVTHPNIEMVEAVKSAATYVKDLYDDFLDDLLYLETPVNLAPVDADLFGTLDIAILRGDKKHLHIIDYKHGVGTIVEPENNEQLLYYALGMYYHLNLSTIEKVTLTIIQPRAPHERGPIRSWDTTVEKLKEFEFLLKRGVERVRKPDAKTFAGAWCKFCPASLNCPSTKTEANKAAQIAFNDTAVDIYDLVPETKVNVLKTLSPETLSNFLKASEYLESLISQANALATDMLKRGVDVPGFKLVWKQARRKWVNEDEAQKVLEKYPDAWELKTPKQVESSYPKLKDKVNELTASISTGLTLVPESDKRPAVDNIREVFSDEVDATPKEIEPKKKVRKPKIKNADEIDLGF